MHTKEAKTEILKMLAEKLYGAKPNLAKHTLAGAGVGGAIGAIPGITRSVAGHRMLRAADKLHRPVIDGLDAEVKGLAREVENADVSVWHQGVQKALLKRKEQEVAMAAHKVAREPGMRALRGAHIRQNLGGVLGAYAGTHFGAAAHRAAMKEYLERRLRTNVLLGTGLLGTGLALHSSARK